MKRVLILGIILGVFAATSASAQQNKVVVVPLGSSSQANAAFAGGGQTIALSNISTTVVRSVTITVQKEGIIIVNASVYVELTGVTGDGYDSVRASITTGTSLDTDHWYLASDYETAVHYQTMGMTRAFAVLPGTYTYNLVMDVFAGSANAGDSHMNAIFIPVAGATAARQAAPMSTGAANCDPDITENCEP